MSAFNTQVDGHHYTDKPIQPIMLAYKVFGGDTAACKIAKYLTREKDSWSKQIDKASHVLELYLEMIDYSPIPHQIRDHQRIYLDQFIKQEPTEVQEPLRTILTFLLNSKCTRAVVTPEVGDAFQQMRIYYSEGEIWTATY